MLRTDAPLLAIAAAAVMVVVLPREGAVLRVRAPLLLWVGAPWVMSVVFGPLGAFPPPYTSSGRGALLMVQYGSIVLSLGMAMVMLGFMRGARITTALVAGAAIYVTVVLAGISALVIEPTS